jgi:KipI family sensor histidine kinase inhibitor
MSIKVNNNISLEIAGENALILYFYDHGQKTNSVVVNDNIKSMVQHAVVLIQKHLSTDIIDLIPSYSSILVMFNLAETDHHHIRNKLKNLFVNYDNQKTTKGQLIELPVYYGLEVGQDLLRIAAKSKLSVEQVISLHQTQEYNVYAIGFAPGFAYLGEVDERIAMPRLSTPRLKVPKGAVAIADRQTAVYPAQSPGGWNIIGLCPIDMFKPEAEPIMTISVGDRVKFIAIDRAKFLELGGVLPISNVKETER